MPNSNNQKKYANLSTLQAFLDNLKTKFANIGHKHTISDISDYKVDDALSSTSTNPVQNKVLNAEFDEIAVSMRAIGQALDGKSDSTHNHDDDYAEKGHNHDGVYAIENHNHDNAYDTKGSATEALASAQSYTDTKTKDLASNTAVDNKITAHNTSDSAHNDIRDLISGLTNRLNTLANSDDTTLDQMSEVVAYIKNNKSLIDGITTNKVNVADIINNLTTNVTNKPLSAAQGVAIKNLIDTLQEELDSHIHPISDVSGLQAALDGKAPNEHGIHVGYSTTAPVMDGTASVGTASTVARSDHKHPTDTSRASQIDFDTHTSDTVKHITATERTNWNAAKAHADSAHDYLPLIGGEVTGTTIFSKVQDAVADSYNSPAVVIGGKPSEAHLELDNNEIQAKLRENAAGNLFLNSNGGTVHVGFGGLKMDSEASIVPEYAITGNVGTGELPFNKVYGRYHYLYGGENSEYGNFRVGTTGTASTAGVATLQLGNAIATGTAHNASGKITMYGSGTAFTNIMPSDRTSGSNAVKLPSTSGTLATVENSTKVATMSTSEYNALPTEQVDANTLYMLTDTEEIVPQIQIITWGADD